MTAWLVCLIRIKLSAGFFFFVFPCRNTFRFCYIYSFSFCKRLILVRAAVDLEFIFQEHFVGGGNIHQGLILCCRQYVFKKVGGNKRAQRKHTSHRELRTEGCVKRQHYRVTLPSFSSTVIFKPFIKQGSPSISHITQSSLVPFYDCLASISYGQTHG